MDELEFIEKNRGNFTLSFRYKESRKVLVYKGKTLFVIPDFLAKYLDDFQIVTEYQHVKIDSVFNIKGKHGKS